MHTTKHLFILSLFTLALSTLVSTISAQNPIIRDQFTADPTARVFNDRVYLYPSHDIPAPPDQRQEWFCMADYHVFSSDDLTEWTDHGVIVDQEDVPWGKPRGHAMWAPDCVSKDGDYYFYFPDAPRLRGGFAIGVAVAKSPTGPFTCEPEPIAGVMGIDPCVLLDDDGQAYLYWAGGAIRGARLQDNMKQLDGEMQQMEGLPDGFKEGPFVFKHQGHYYLTFPWVRQEGGTETLAYAMSDKPLGPWTFKGIIMKEHPNRCWTNHHSIVNYRGEWLLFYHHNDYSPNFDKLRSAHIDRLYFNADGTIQEVTPTLRGVGVSKASRRIEVDRYSACSEGVESVLNDTVDTFRGWHAVLPHAGSWLTYADVDFNGLNSKGRKAKKADMKLVAKVRAHAGTTLAVREGSPTGRIIAQMRIEEEGGIRFGQWQTLATPLSYLPKGITTLCLVAEGEGVEVDWLLLKGED